MADAAGRFRGPIKPILAEVMRNRLAAGLLSAAGCVQVLLTALGLAAWPCVWRMMTGLACPSCGLSRGVAAAACGQWAEAIAHHPLAPAFAVGMAMLLSAAVLPARPRSWLIDRVQRVERCTGIVWIVVGAMALRYAWILARWG